MSDDWITLIPRDPRFVPDESRRMRACDRFAEIAPTADEIEVEVSDTVLFFDCGGNFERIRCPTCTEVIPVEWWQDQMDNDHADEGFRLSKIETPCCGAAHTLNQLVYEWTQGFGRFAIQVMNPNIGQLDKKMVGELEEILDTELRVIYQHL